MPDESTTTTDKASSSAKLTGLLLALVCLTVLMITKSVDADQGMIAFVGIVMYLTGNGVAALRGKPSLPAIGTRNVTLTTTTTTPDETPAP